METLFWILFWREEYSLHGQNFLRYPIFFVGRFNQNEKLVMSYNHMVAPYKLSTKTIGEIVDEAADKYGDKEALVFFSDNIRMSFRQFKEKVRSILQLNIHWSSCDSDLSRGFLGIPFLLAQQVVLERLCSTQ